MNEKKKNLRKNDLSSLIITKVVLGRAKTILGIDKGSHPVPNMLKVAATPKDTDIEITAGHATSKKDLINTMDRMTVTTNNLGNECMMSCLHWYNHTAREDFSSHDIIFGGSKFSTSKVFQTAA